MDTANRLPKLVLASALLWSTSAGAVTSYIGQIRIFAAEFCPAGYLPLNGQIIAITDNEALFSLIGTTYGGDGQSTFALPTARPMRAANGEPLMQCISMFGVYPSAF